MGSGFDGQQFCQEKLLPGVADVGVVAREWWVLIGSSLSPRMWGREIQGMEGMIVAEIARLIVVRDSELAGRADS